MRAARLAGVLTPQMRGSLRASHAPTGHLARALGAAPPPCLVRRPRLWQRCHGVSEAVAAPGQAGRAVHFRRGGGQWRV